MKTLLLSVFAILVSFQPILAQPACEIENLVVEANPCNNDGTFFVDLEFDYNTSSDSFHLVVNGQIYGTWAYSDLDSLGHITVGPFDGDGVTIYTFVVLDSKVLNCMASFTLGAINCPTDPCELERLKAESICHSDGTFDWLVFLEYGSVPNDSFDLWLNQGMVGSYPLDSLPVLVDTLQGGAGTTDHFRLCITGHPDCCIEEDFQTPDCPMDTCKIYNVETEVQPCHTDSTYFIHIADIDYQATSDSFFVESGDTTYGPFNYMQVDSGFVTIGPFDGDGTTLPELIIYDQDNDSCEVTVTLPPTYCGDDCLISNLDIEFLWCYPDGSYDAELNFYAFNTDDSLFTLQVNDSIWGDYSYDSIPLILEGIPVPPDDDLVHTILVSDNDTCFAELTYNAPDCDSLLCNLLKLDAEPECNNDGSYYWNLDIAHGNVPGDTFQVWINQEFVGEFLFDDLPIQIDDFTTSPISSTDVIKVCINGFPHCCLEEEFDKPDCDINCEISDLIAEAGDCNDDGYFYVDISFNYIGVTDSFAVGGNGQFHGLFSYNELLLNGHVTIGPFIGDGQTNYTFVVADHNNPLCEDEVILGTVDCTPPDCELFDLEAVAECINDSTYVWHIDVDHGSVPSDSFDVTINNEYVGTFHFDDLPVTIDDFTPRNSTTDLIEVCVNGFPDCCLIDEFKKPDCDGDCEIWDLIVEAGDCNDDGFFYVDLTFHYSGVSDSFVVAGNGQVYGTFSYADLDQNGFITLGPLAGDGQTHYEFIVIDQEDQNCLASYDLGTIDCTADCEITNLIVEAGDCNDDGFFFVDLAFDYTGTSDSFIVAGNGHVYGTFSYADLDQNGFITLGPLAGDGQTHYEFIVFDQKDHDCMASFDLGTVDCGPDCEITDLIVEASDCNDDGFFFIDLTFNYTGVSDSFTVAGNGNVYGTFSYSEIDQNGFITLGPFAGDGQTHYEFIVFDQDDDNCSDFFELGVIDCNPDCELFKIEAIPICLDDSTYVWNINLDYGNVSNDFFNVSINGVLAGTFRFDDLPVTVDDFSPSNSGFDHIEVCVNDFPDCCIEEEFHQPVCDDDCEIYDLFVEAGDCNDDGFFFVKLNFNYSGVSDSFVVAGNGMVHGTFSYDDLDANGFVTLGPFPGDGLTVYEFVVFDQENHDCGDSYLLGVIDCGPDCELFEIIAQPDCKDDSTYVWIIDVHFGIVPNDFFDLYINNEFIGFYNFDDLPLVIHNFTPSNGSHDVIEVCVNDFPDCCLVEEFQKPICHDDCEINDLIVEAGDCNDDGYFFVDLSFNYSGVSDSFVVAGNGQVHGVFSYDDLDANGFVTVGPFPGDGQTVYEFVVFDQDNHDCRAFKVLGIIDCDDNCELFEIVADAECLDDGSYVWHLDLEYGNVPNDFFDLWINNEYVGTFRFDDLPITIDDFVPRNSDTDLFKVCVNDYPDCCLVEEFLKPICDGNCEIWDLETEVDDCVNGEFLLHLSFNFNAVSDSFIVEVNGVKFGTFSYADIDANGFVTIGPLPGDGITPYVISVSDQDDPHCGDSHDLGVIDCGLPDCELFHMVAAPECIDDSTYIWHLQLVYGNIPQDSFDLWINNEYVGAYAFDDLPVTIDDFEPRNSDTDLFKVCVQNDPHCCITREFTKPDCDDKDCNIWNLDIDFPGCHDDSHFYVKLSFDYDGVTDSFQVIVNGQVYGTYSYNLIDSLGYVKLGPFVGDGSIFYEFTVRDQEQLHCYDIRVLGFIDCDQKNNTPTLPPNKVNVQHPVTGNTFTVFQVDTKRLTKVRVLNFNQRYIRSQWDVNGKNTIRVQIDDVMSGTYILELWYGKRPYYYRVVVLTE